MSELPWQRGTYPRAEATARRVRRFARITGLKPSRASTRVFGYDRETGAYLYCPEGADHTNVWHDGKRYVVSTEPYGSSGKCQALEAWCGAHGWAWRRVPALGMWNPPFTVLYVLSPPKNGVPLDEIEAFREKSFAEGLRSGRIVVPGGAP